MTKFSYKYQIYDTDRSNVEQDMNRLGTLGWEIIGFTLAGRILTVIFKKEYRV